MGEGKIEVRGKGKGRERIVMERRDIGEWEGKGEREAGERKEIS